MHALSIVVRLVLLAIAAIVVPLPVLGCDQDPGGAHANVETPLPLIPDGWTRGDTGPLTITVTTGQVGDLVRQIGGDDVTILRQLMGSGTDPHTYVTNEDDIRALDRAEMILCSGLHLEGKMVDVLKRLARKKPVLAVAETLPLERLLDQAGAHDPHVWFDPELWAMCADAVAAGLAEVDPANAATYRANGAAYRVEILDVGAWARDQLAGVPTDQRVMVTAHDAFRYFGRAFDIEVRGLQGISTESEPGMDHIEDLVDLMVKRRVKAIFVETSIPEGEIKPLLEGCRAANHHVVIGGKLYSDAMGDEGTPEATYAGMMRHNVTNLVSGLQ